MAHKAPYSNEIVKNTHASLQKTVKAALIRKKKLGQYSVIWRENHVITEGDDFPLVSILPSIGAK